jgi:hypothetical protein
VKQEILAMKKAVADGLAANDPVGSRQADTGKTPAVNDIAGEEKSRAGAETREKGRDLSEAIKLLLARSLNPQVDERTRYLERKRLEFADIVTALEEKRLELQIVERRYQSLTSEED